MGGCTRVCAAAGDLSNAIRKISAGRNLLVSFAFWLLMLFLINGKPFGIAQLREMTGGQTILDMTFTTSPREVYAVLMALWEAGRAFDLTRIVPLDLVFPFSYALFLSVAVTWLLLRVLPQDSPWVRLNLLPVIAAAADYCENAGVITMLLTYPVPLDLVAAFTSAAYIVKSVFLTMSFLAVFAALALWVVVSLLKMRRTRTGAPPGGSEG